MLVCLKGHRTQQELDAGLRSWVETFRDARKTDQVKLAKEIQRFIDAVIKKKDLDRTIVYGPEPRQAYLIRHPGEPPRRP